VERYEELRERALHYLKNAHQGISFTYKLVQDPHVLLSVVNNLFLASTNAMGSILQYEVLHRRLSPFDDTFESKYRLMRMNIIEQYHIDESHLRIIRDLKDIIIAHNESPIEFSRGKRLVICGDNYELKELSIESMTKAYEKTKLFIDEVIRITS
jgi:hypothetical protein